MTAHLRHDQIQALITEHLQAEQLRSSKVSRPRGRPPVPHREWLRAEVSSDLVELLRQEAADSGLTVTALMSIVLCERYGVRLTADNRVDESRAGTR